MKKNMIMRIASILMILTLISTCAISGTFAKYVTSASGTDSARVAKWNITKAGDFGATTFTDTYTNVAGASDAVVVAPGTTMTTPTTYEIDGTPETAYELTFDFEKVKEIFLGDGTNDKTYTYTGYDSTVMGGTFGATTYIPVSWTVTIATAKTIEQIDTNGAEVPTKSTATTYTSMAALEAALDNSKISFGAGEECDVVITINWNWAFENSHDKEDTILGDLVADNTALTATDAQENVDYCTDIEYKFQVTVTQVD